MGDIKIASKDKVCVECSGSGIKELQPFYYIACLWCGGTGKAPKEVPHAETESK